MATSGVHEPVRALRAWQDRVRDDGNVRRADLGVVLAQLGRAFATSDLSTRTMISAELERAAFSQEDRWDEEAQELVTSVFWAAAQFSRGCVEEAGDVQGSIDRRARWQARGQRAKALLVLSDAGRLRPVQLAAVLDRPRQTANRLLNELVNEGLAVRVASTSDDKRAAEYETTVLGDQEVAELRSLTDLPVDGLVSARGWELVEDAAKRRSMSFNVTEAIELLNDAGALAERAGDVRLAAAVLGEVATTERQAGRKAAATAALKHLGEIADLNPADPVVASRFAYEKGRLLVHDQPTQARQLLATALADLGGQVGVREVRRRYWCTFAIADLERQVGRLFDAASLSREAAEGFAHLDEEYATLCAQTLSGFVYRLAGNFELAEVELLRVLEQAGPYQRRRAEALFHLAEAHRSRGRLDEAEAGLSEALSLWEGLGQPTAVAFGRAAFGAVRFQQGEYKHALAMLEQAADTIPPHHSEGRALIERRLGAVCRELGEHDRARQHLRAAATLYEKKVFSPMGHAEALIGLAKVEKAKRQLCLRQAVDALLKIRPPSAITSPLDAVALSPWVFDAATDLAVAIGNDNLVEAVRSVREDLAATETIDIDADTEEVTEMSREPVLLAA